MRKIPRLALLIVALGLMVFGGGVAVASHTPPGSVYVDEGNCPDPGNGSAGDPFCTIQDAVAHASANDTIEVAAGTYAEGITVPVGKDGLKIQGANAGIAAGRVAGIRGAESIVDGGFLLSSDAVEIDGFTIQNGAELFGGGSIGGVTIGTGNDDIVKNNIFEGDGSTCVYPAVHQSASSDGGLIVLNNEMFDWCQGVYLNLSSGNVIEDNSIHDICVGIASDGQSSLTVQFNEFADSSCSEAVGIGTAGSAIVINNNNFLTNSGGINLYSGNSVDGTLNYWGCEEGPGESGCAEVGGSSPMDVSFSPWLCSAYPNTGATNNLLGTPCHHGGSVKGNGKMDSSYGDYKNLDVTDATTVGDWIFNRDPANVTPADFSLDHASVGSGSIHVDPITNTVGGNGDKFILEYFPDPAIPVVDFDSFSIDFLIDESGTNLSPSQFYVNVYTLTPTPQGFYDCRFDFVASSGSPSTWTALSLSSGDTPDAKGDRTGGSCPSTIADMETFEAGSVVSAITVNLGDTSANDFDEGGYFDNANLTVAGTTTTWDFEPPYITAEAKFNFDAKYKKNATLPSGTTHFDFKEAGLKFKSDSYEWLVVNGDATNAQYLGTGKINNGLAPSGQPYDFMVWAKDLTPGSIDTFRIKIWYEDGSKEVVVYDNGFDQEIGHGKVEIKTK